MRPNEKYFGQSSDPMNENTIEDMIGADETLLWQDKPKKSAYIAAAVIKMLPLALLWLVVDGFFIYMLITLVHAPWYVYLFFVLHLAPVWIWIYGIVKAVIEIKNIHYAITDKRIIVRSGIVVDFKFISYSEVNSVNVKVGIIDRILGVGDIYITANTQSAVLYDIKAPYKVVNYIQKVARDIQTDMNFPNAYRPDNNPGFNTKYDNKFEN